MTLPEVAPFTTLVVNVAPGPSAASTAAEVTSLVVEAGVDGWPWCCCAFGTLPWLVIRALPPSAHLARVTS